MVKKVFPNFKLLYKRETFKQEINSNSNKNNDKNNFFTNIKRPHFHTYQTFLEKCKPSNCPFPNTCVSSKICKCSADRANFSENPINPHVNCSYIRKKQLIAFLLESIFISVGHFYIGSNLIGCLKLITFLAAIFFAFRYEEKWTKNLSTFLFSLIFSWWVIDIGLFSVNYYMDKNNVQLMEW